MEMGFISMQINIVIAAPGQNESGRVCSYAITRRAAVHQGGLAFWRFNIFICLQSNVKGEICSINGFNAGVKLFEGLRTNGPPVVMCSKVPGLQPQRASVTSRGASLTR